MEEFKIISVKERNLNKFIEKHRKQYPNYEVFNICATGTGGQMGGTIRYHIIWRLKDN